MGIRRRVIISPEARVELRRIGTVRPAEWRRIIVMISEQPGIGLKVGTWDGRDVRRVVIARAKVLVYYVDWEDDLYVVSVHHGSAEKRPLEN